jgi:hypothetical protein
VHGRTATCPRARTAPHFFSAPVIAYWGTAKRSIGDPSEQPITQPKRPQSTADTLVCARFSAHATVGK